MLKTLYDGLIKRKFRNFKKLIIKEKKNWRKISFENKKEKVCNLSIDTILVEYHQRVNYQIKIL